MNSLDLVPLAAQRGAAFALFAGSAIMVTLVTLLVTRVVALAPLPARARQWVPILVTLFLGSWLAFATVFADGAHFPLLHAAARQPLSALVAFGPFVVALLLLWRSPTWRAINAATPSHWLIGLQAYRMLGAMFLFPFLAYGALPGGFAWPAGVGDFLTGFFSVSVAAAVARGDPGSTRRAVLWNVLGILDLIVAPATAVLTQAQVLTMYPLAIVPLFLGPPLGILLHVHSLRNLAIGQRAHATRAETFPSVGAATA